MWKRFGLGAQYTVTDPDTKQPAERSGTVGGERKSSTTERDEYRKAADVRAKRVRLLAATVRAAGAMGAASPTPGSDGTACTAPPPPDGGGRRMTRLPPLPFGICDTRRRD